VSRRADLVYAATTALAAVVIGLTGSRGALVGLVAGTGVILALVWRNLGRTARRLTLAGCAVFLVVGVAGVAYRQSQSDPFRYQRLRIWRATTEIVAAHPALGAGPGQLRNVARGYQFPDGHGPLQYDRGFETTHSDLLRVPAELGIPGLIAMLAILATVALEITRRHAEGTLTAAGIGATGALAALAAHALVENLSSRSALIALAVVLVGSLVSVSQPSPRQLGTVARFALLAVIALMFMAGDVAPYLAWREMLGLPRGHLSDADAKRLVLATVWNPIHPGVWRKRAEHIVGGGTSFDLDGYTLAREAVEHAVRLDPQAPEFQVGVARVEAAACSALFAGDPGTRERMTRAYSTVEKLDPYQALWPLEEAEAALDCGAPDVAEAAARRALALEPEAASPRLVLAAALLRSGGAGAVAEAERLLTEALEQASKWSSSMPPGAYARRLLTLEAQNLERIEREIREARDARGSG
jgi:O-Antigen ligase